MDLLALAIDTGPFRYLRFLLIPVVAMVVIAAGVYLVRHSHGKKRS